MDHLPMTKIENPPGCIFHRTGLSNETKVTDEGWRLQTLGKTMKDLNHENVCREKYIYIEGECQKGPIFWSVMIGIQIPDVQILKHRKVTFTYIFQNRNIH